MSKLSLSRVAEKEGKFAELLCLFVGVRHDKEGADFMIHSSYIFGPMQ